MDILVTVDHLAKSFGAHDIFDKVSFTIRQGEKLGLVGVNGSGKTTLLRCLMDPSFADKGTVQYAGEIRVGYVEQGLTISKTKPSGSSCSVPARIFFPSGKR